MHTLVRACDRLATGIDFVRMDLYLTSSSPSGMAFGEATFTPRAGHNLFDPPSIDAGLGRRWCDGRRSGVQQLQPQPAGPRKQVAGGQHVQSAVWHGGDLASSQLARAQAYGGQRMGAG